MVFLGTRYIEASVENEAENPDGNEFPASTSASVTTRNADTQEDVIHVENTETANPSTTKKSKTTHVFRAPQSRKRKMVNCNISTISAAIDKLDKVVQSYNNETNDEFDIFAKHVAVQLKQMPLYDAIICQEQIQTVIRQKRLELLSRQSQCHTTPSPAFSNAMEGEYWSSSVSNASCNREECGEDSQEPSDIVAEGLTNILY